MTSMPIGEEWVGRTVDERFPLLQWLGGSAECGVFLTERPDGSGGTAAIKIMGAAVAEATDRAAGWDAVLALKQRHLLRVYGHGRCEMDGAQLAYVVTEYAPEVLEEILAGRALSVEEARAMLWPLLEALGSLHARGLIHGHVKPRNIMAQGDVLKLTMDHVLRVGAAGGVFTAGEYDAPELARGVVTPEADVWSLGVTLVEVLTQRRPVAGADGEMVVPEGVPEPFGEIARACLRVDRKERCGLAEIRARLKGEWVEPVAPVAAETGRPVVADRVLEPGFSARKGNWRMVAVAALVAVFAIAAFLLWPRAVGRGDGSSVSDSTAAPVTAMPVKVPGVVVRRVPPEVLRSALETIYGTVRVDVRVTAGTGGRVVNAAFVDAGPSRYFAQAAMVAAKQWIFRPAQVHGRAVRGVWLLRFEFTRDGSEVTATEVSP
ncbi:MAG: protein kinase domain-containing protein [Acidobacteriaceae bacterium]